MLEFEALSIAFFLLIILTVYYVANKRSLFQKEISLYDYLWRLKQITGKSEYEIFLIAAEEKGWPAYQVDRHFKKFLSDQSLPVYVKEFLEDGKEYIRTYRGKSGDFFNKKLLIFYTLFALVILGGSLILALCIIPRHLDY